MKWQQSKVRMTSLTNRSDCTIYQYITKNTEKPKEGTQFEEFHALLQAKAKIRDFN